MDEDTSCKNQIATMIGLFKESINETDLHAFVDGIINGISTVLYATVHQNSEANAELLCSKSSLLRKNLT